MEIQIDTPVRSFRRWINIVQGSSSTTLFIAAVVVGAGTGLGGVLFIHMIQWVTDFLFGWLPTHFPAIGRGWIFLAPIIGGLIAGPIIAFFASEAKGHGVPEVMQAIAIKGGRIRPKVVIAKVLASSACIGSGGSAGREGPIVQVGAALGSTIGQWLHLSETKIRNLVACGAAAGIAATFNAPIAGVLFAIEIILGEMAMEDMGSVVISSITASTIARTLLGNRPAFTIPMYKLQSPIEIVLSLGLGVVGALVGVFFIKVLYAAEDVFDHWHFPNALKPAVGGVLLGLTGFLYPLLLGSSSQSNAGLPVLENIPQVFGAGFPTIEAGLQGQLSIGLMFALLFLKVFATAFTLGSGNSGGVFAPGLFMGAMAGGVFGWVAQWIFPQLSAGPGLYATVGMAAAFAAAARAPLTATLIVFEMTDDFHILLPLMAAVIVSTVLAEKMHKESIYTLKLVRKGIQLFRGRDMDVMSSVLVKEVMEKDPVTVTPDASLSDLLDLLETTKSHGFPVLNEQGKLWGVVSLGDLQAISDKKEKVPENLTVKDIACRTPLTVYPNDTVSEALIRMAPRDLSRVPVVSPDGQNNLLGIVRRANIIRAYEVGLVKRGFAVGELPGTPKGTATGKFFISENSPIEGKTLAELNLPEYLLIIHIKRGNRIILPHGNTKLKAGDTITILARDGDVTRLEKFAAKANEIDTQQTT